MWCSGRSWEVKFVCDCFCLLKEDQCFGSLCLVLRSGVWCQQIGYDKRLGDVRGGVGVSYRVCI